MNLPGIHDWHREVSANPHRPILLGIFVLLAWALGFGAWAALAPLNGAVVAAGSFVATGQNKQIQHLEGGIVREMLVTEGMQVEPGQLLVRLDDTAARAKLRRLLLRQYRLTANIARLKAEIRFEDFYEVPPSLREVVSDPEVAAIIAGQETELVARRRSQRDQELVLQREISGLKESIEGYESQARSTRTRLVLFGEEIDDKDRLLDRQLIRKSEVLALQRAEAAISGELGELLGRLGDARERIARADQKIAEIRSRAVQNAMEELRNAETELDDVEEQILAANDVLNRTEVRAPVRGIVVKLHHHTPNGVVGAGSAILELLPLNDELVIEARVKPTDISHVAIGQAALVRLTALNQRITPMVQAKLIYVSADAVPEQVLPDGDPDPQKGYSFIVRARLDPQDLRAKLVDLRPTPGMPADIYVKTGQRTFLEYLLRPITDSFSRAFREQ